MNGLLFVDKTEGWTSHDAVAKTRRALGTKKVGHAGTLDPMATGLLTLGVGPATRLLTHMVGLDKTYTATIRLGAATPSDDRMSEPSQTATQQAIDALDDASIDEAIAALTGDISQVPSQVSAIKVDGKRAYDRVRSGETVELKSRSVTISEFAVLARRRDVDAAHPALDLDVRVRCSSGTYVRALARDLGASLGVHGHLVALRRTAVGPFRLADNERGATVNAMTTDELVSAAETPGAAPLTLTTPADIARALFATYQCTDAEETAMMQGKRVEIEHPDAPLVAMISESDRLIGLSSVKRGVTRTVTNFPAPVTPQAAQAPSEGAAAT